MSLVPRKTPVPASQRRKTVEACDPCRSRKVKCDGGLPCKACTNLRFRCVYDPSTSTNRVTGELDAVNARLAGLERAVFSNSSFKPPHMPPTPSQDVDDSYNPEPRFEAVSTFNPSTGSVEFYGSTSNLALARLFSHKLREHERTEEIPNRIHPNSTDSANNLGYHVNAASRSHGVPSKRRHTETLEPPEMELNRLYEHTDCVPVPWQRERRRKLREDVANAHVGIYFDTIHDLLPILDPASFMDMYRAFWDDGTPSAENDGESVVSQQRDCLVYAVLAMGASYSDSNLNNAEWAASYFADAQQLLGKLYDAVSIQTVQAALLMGCYARHVIKPNLAYNYIGIAIRLAYSIGLNRDNSESSAGQDQVQAARRTWWMIYGIEAEQCLDSGRPMSIRDRDAKAPFPKDFPDASVGAGRTTLIIELSKFSMIIRKVIDLVSSINDVGSNTNPFVGRLIDLQVELCAWRDALPPHLQFEKISDVPVRKKLDSINWVKRQQQSIHVHFNHLMILLHRPFFRKTQITTPVYTVNMSVPICIGSAQDNIALIHHILSEDQSIRRWTYYCYYCLTSTLILLMRIFECPREEADRYIAMCTKSYEIFNAFDFRPARRCAALVRRVLDGLGKPPADHGSSNYFQDAAHQPGSSVVLAETRVGHGLPSIETMGSCSGSNDVGAAISAGEEVSIGDIFGDSYKDFSIEEIFMSSRISGEDIFSGDISAIFNIDS